MNESIDESIFLNVTNSGDDLEKNQIKSRKQIFDLIFEENNMRKKLFDLIVILR